MRGRLRASAGLLGVMLVAGSIAAVASGSALAADHYYCTGLVRAGAVCTSGIQHTYANNNVAYAGPSLTWCEGLATPGGTYYSAICVSGRGNGYTIYGTWRDWCGWGVAGGCGWAINGSTSLVDLMQNQGSSGHTFTAHSYW